MNDASRPLAPKHPVLVMPGLAAIQHAAQAEGIAPEKMVERIAGQLWEQARHEEENMLDCGWEPPIWKVCDALLGLPCEDQTFIRHIRERFGYDWSQWAEAMRRHLGFEHPVRFLLIMGGNRSGKSEYSAKRSIQIMRRLPKANVYAAHMSNPRSIRDQQPLFWKYFPAEWRTAGKTAHGYIAYKEKTGFAEGSFIAPNGSSCAFLNYMQEIRTALEGIEADWVVPDELIPPDWIETLTLRLATRSGRACSTFTPVNGYTPSVKLFVDGSTVRRTSLAYLLPTDGEPMNEPLALNLAPWEYEEIWRSHYDAAPFSVAPQSRPEDVCAWLETGPEPERSGEVFRPFGYGIAQMPPPPGRQFERVPRVLKCVDPKKAVVYFQSNDNPYGTPREIIDICRTQGKPFIRERFCGIASKLATGVWPRFNREIHVVRREQVPTSGDNYLVIDPAKGRNWYMGWFRVQDRKACMYREWPGPYHIPGVGVPGPWAVPSGKNEGFNDGAIGEGQSSFGWGYSRYKFEIARLERWKAYLDWFEEMRQERGDDIADLVARVEDIEEWDDDHPDDVEIISGRIIDSRAASEARQENDRVVTVYESLSELGFDLDLAPGGDIAEGWQEIADALDIGPGGSSRFSISEDCPNAIYALENYTGKDGNKGAMKDVVDVIRYFWTSGCVLLPPAAPRGGFSYGARRRRRMSGDRRLPLRARFGSED